MPRSMGLRVDNRTISSRSYGRKKFPQLYMSIALRSILVIVPRSKFVPPLVVALGMWEN
jgi:hypothetical protein